MDITNESLKAIQSFGQGIQNLSGEVEITADIVTKLKNVFGELGAEADSLVQANGRLTEKGFNSLEKSLDTAGKNYLKSMQSIQKDTDMIFGKLNNAFGDFAKRIPVIGKTLEKGFSTMLNSLTTRMDALLAKTWGRMGAGARAGAAAGATALIAGGALLLKQFNEIEKASISLSEQTGLSGKNLANLRSNMVTAHNASIAFGVSMKESADATAGLVTSMGNFRKITPELIRNTSIIAKYTGLGAEQAAKFTGTLVKGFGMSANDVENFSDRIVDFATKSGVNARKVMADIAQNTSLMSVYMSRGEDYLKRTAVQAQKLGMSLSEADSVSKGFLDLDSAAESVGLLNQYTGSSLNAMEMFNLAARKDTEGIMNRLNKAFSTPQGIRFIQEMPGLAEQFASKFGMNLQQLRIAAGLEKDMTESSKVRKTESEKIAETVAKQQTSLEQITNQLKSDVFPIINSIAESIVSVVSGIGPTGIKAALGVAAALTGLGLGKFLLKGTTVMPMITKEIGFGGGSGLGGDYGGDSGRDRRNRNKPKGRVGRAFDAVKNLSGAKNLSGGTGSKALSTGFKFIGGAGKKALGPLASAAFMIPTALEAWNSKDPEKMIPAALGFLGGLGGAALGSIALPGIGTVAGGAAGGVAGEALGEWLIGGTDKAAPNKAAPNKAAPDKAATGRVVSSPNLFMVGEENRKEIIVPTERIRKGMPIDSGVAKELASIGVPGYNTGRRSRLAAAGTRRESQIQRSANERVVAGALSDPAMIKQREVAVAQAAQRERDEQRRMMKEVENKSLEIMEEERRVMTDIAKPAGDFAKTLSWWEKLKQKGAALAAKAAQKAREYAGKTRDRFFENLRNSNGNLRDALSMTWQQTVGDLEQLQSKLYGKLEQWAGQIVDKIGNWVQDKAEQAGKWAWEKIKDVGNSILDAAGVNNEANRQQITNATKGLLEAGRESFKEAYDRTATEQGRLDAEVQADALEAGVGGSKPELGEGGVTGFFKNVGTKIGETVGNAVYSATNAFSTGREFSHVSKDLGGMDSSSFTEGMNFAEKGIFKLGETFGALEQKLGPMVEGMGSLAKSVDGTAVAMLAGGDAVGALTYTAKKAATTKALNLGTENLLKGTKLEGRAGSIVAGAGALAEGDIKGAAKAVGIDIGSKALGSGASGIATGLGASASAAKYIGGGVAAAGVGAVGGLMKGDMKAAGRGALEGAVGYAIGAALTPVLGPLGPIVGGFIAGPATAGIIKTGKEAKKGIGNMGKGIGKMFSGDFKGGGKAILKGTGQVFMAGFKGLGEFAKGIGGMFGIGKKNAKDHRKEVLKKLAGAVRGSSGGGKIFQSGGKLSKNKKFQEALAGAVKIGKNGPDKVSMSYTINAIQKAFGLSPEIAQAVIYAGLGADMTDEQLAYIDQELGVGWESVLKEGSWQKAFDASGTLRGTGETWKGLAGAGATDSSAAMNLLNQQDGTAAREAAAASAAAEKEQRAAERGSIRDQLVRFNSDGSGISYEEIDELRRLGIEGREIGREFTDMDALSREGGGTGIVQATGNIYLDGVLVGRLSNDAAAEAGAAGLPTPKTRGGGSVGAM